MDLLSDVGMVTLGKVWKIILWVGSEIRMTCGIKLCQQLCLVSISTCLHPSPRTALAVVLQGDHDAGWLAHYALKCSSWVATNAGTSSRSACSSIGNTEFQSVRDANCLGSRIFDCISWQAIHKWIFMWEIIAICWLLSFHLRMLLLMMVAVCLNAAITLEQPFSSVFEFYPRFREFMEMLQRHGGQGAVPWWNTSPMSQPLDRLHIESVQFEDLVHKVFPH